MLNIYNKRWIFIAVSAVVILAGLISFFIQGGLNVDIDFAGGTSIVFNTTDKNASQDDIVSIVKEAVPGISGTIRAQATTDKPEEFTIKTMALSTAQSEAVLDALKAKYVPDAENYNDYSVSSFTAAYGKQLAQEAGLALFIAIALMLIYISVRFEFLSGVSAIIALIHDVLIMLSIYAIFGISVNSSFIAVILTILGYSINNTIVVFDRVRENRKLARKETMAEIVDKSITGTLGRSINTTITTLIMVVLLFILGGNSIREFALPLIIGLIGGAYSSIFIVSPVWAMMKGANKKAVK